MRLAVSRGVHIVFYGSCLFIVLAVCTMPISMLEKGIHSFAWIYLVLAYAYFFDEQPPKYLRVRRLVETKDKEGEFLDKLLGISQESLSLMRKIQFHEDYQVVNRSIDELNKRYLQLQRLTPPARYRQRHTEILKDVDGFLEGLSDGNYYLAQGQTK